MIEFGYAINSDAVVGMLAAFQESLADQSPALARIADDFREMIARQFASEGRAEGTPWAPLAPATLRRRRGGGILFSTGALLRSLQEPGAPGHVEELEAHSLALGTRLPYAQYHQSGTRRGLPARPLIVLSQARSERWVEIVRQHIGEKTLLLGEKELGGKQL